MIYSNYRRNHVIIPGREQALDDFLNVSIMQNDKVVKHKMKYAYNSNSEDALTWSCFDVLRNLPHDRKIQALDEIMEDAFGNEKHFHKFSFANEENIEIHIGKWYSTKVLPNRESTEVDASIETDSKLIFIEAKLYNLIGLTNEQHLHNQIIRKMRVGLNEAARRTHNAKTVDFYFIFLDIAPIEYMIRYGEKAFDANIFTSCKGNTDLLNSELQGISYSQSLEGIAQNMGWLTWACLFKTVLRAVIS
jgi:hypothetical protein